MGKAAQSVGYPGKPLGREHWVQRLRLGQLLMDSGLIDTAQLEQGIAEQKRRGGKLGSALVQLGLLSEAAVTQVIARQLHLPLAQLDATTRVPDAVLARLPRDVIAEQQILPLESLEQGHALAVAVCEPPGPARLDALRALVQGWIVPRLAGPRTLAEAIERHLGPSRVPHPSGSLNATPAVSRARPHPAPSSPAGGQRELRAMIELLVEKGLITREEYLEKLTPRENP